MASMAARMPLPTAVPTAGGEAVHGVEQHLLVARGYLDELREAREGDDADTGGGRLLLDEVRGRRLGGQQPAGLDVGRAHAARHVHGQQDGRPARAVR